MDIFTALADWLVYGVMGLAPATPLSGALHFFIEDTAKIFVLLALIVFVIGFFRSMLAPERVRKLLGGKNRVFAFPAAVGLGAVTPFCSCSSVPLFIGFLEAGIPLGVTMAFLITSPMINEIAVFLLLSTLGVKFTLVYVATGLTVGLVGGLVIDRLKLEHWVEDYVWKIRMGEAALPDRPHGFIARVGFGVDQVKEIFGRLWLYVLAGIAIGAALHGFVPAEVLLRYAGPDNPLAVPLAVLIGIPLYSNATGTIPVVEALLAKGVPVGTALALMMSIAALSLPEIIMLKKVLKVPLLAIFTAVLAGSFIAVGYLFNAIYG
ncbi:permease [Magnetospirillum sulfuroxidans]|uniref:Permease n=1 Tax=Magnetospirillum sulfuroxidans TaxID=611300 RepID=A0ABS5IAR2_9PROT|nr:permease [Magnetospirillum sulfuroxidans]MBR9971504.1 permease [Magnetospirillum sulfuroxidans]